jgi:hypothetical protein
MIRAGCIAAHAQPADYRTSGTVKRNTAAEGDNATGELILTPSSASGRCQEKGVEGIRVVQTKKRMPRLNEGVKAGG